MATVTQHQAELDSEKQSDYAQNEVVSTLRAKEVDPDRLPEETRAAEAHIDPEAERRLVWKQDLTIFPLLALVYLLNFIDRTNLGNAKASGLERDLGMAGFDFNIGASIFYVVYILSEFPSNYIVKEYGTRFIPLMMVAFGAVTFSTAYIQSFSGFVIVRVFLGVTEASTLPGCAYILSRYYRRKELVFRMTMFFGFSALLAGAIGGLLAAGFLRLSPITSTVVSWRCIFFVEGIITMIVGVIAIFFFPADLTKTRLFNEQERQLAINRMLADNPATVTTKESTKIKLIGRAFSHPVCWASTLAFAACNVVVQGVAVFLPSIIQSLGTDLTPIQIQLKVVPVYVCAMALCFFAAYASLKTHIHAPYAIAILPLSIVGYSIWLSTSNPNARYAGSFLNLLGVSSAGGFFLTLASINASPDTVRNIVPPIVTGIGATGSIVGTWIYLPSEAKTGFRTANIINLTAAIIGILCAVFIMCYVKYENAARAKGKRDYRLELPEEELHELGWKHPGYRLVI